MSGVKRPVSARSTRLSTRQSEYNSSVTLFSLDASSSSTVVDETETTSSRRHAKSEPLSDYSETDSLTFDEEPKKKKARKVKTDQEKSASPKKQKQKPIPTALDKPHPEPEHWREVYAAIKEMRKLQVAPVDTMGCDLAHLGETDPMHQRFSTLVSLMLSPQTKDQVCDAAVKKLRAAVGGVLSVDAIIRADDSTISDAVNKVGFWRKKALNVKQAAIILRDRWDSDVPKTVDELCELPGVGPKIAFLTLQSAWKLNVGIGVDVHVHRITNRLGWHKPSTKVPEQTRLNLQSWLPLELHPDINHMLVGFGQTVCLPVGPKCGECTLSKSGLCPSAVEPKEKVTKTKKVAKPARVEIAVES